MFLNILEALLLILLEFAVRYVEFFDQTVIATFKTVDDFPGQVRLLGVEDVVVDVSQQANLVLR